MGALKEAGTCTNCGAVSEEVFRGQPCPAGCDTCGLCIKYRGLLAPSHNGSPYCNNAARGKDAGSIASGGKVSHCSCDACF